MATNTERWPGRIALMVAHCAGMVDLVALPVWIGTLVVHYKLDPQQAGSLATLFLASAVLSSLFFAPRLQRMRGRRAASLGFLISATAFGGAASTHSYVAMAVLHAVAGAAAGCALSFTHGTIARSKRPHFLFAVAGTALGVFSVVFLGATPKLVAVLGGPALFHVFGCVMLVAAVVCVVMFPEPPTREAAAQAVPCVDDKCIDKSVWFAALGISCMTIVQAMMFSFLERMGADRGFSVEAITGMLVALGLVNLLPAPLAAVLERRLNARHVVLAGPIAQAGLALILAQSTAYASYASAAVFFPGVIIFTHTFAFGLIAKLDPSGRALATTPAMVMVGSAVGPILGGTLVKFHGYPSLGLAAAAVAGVAVLCFSRARPARSVMLGTH
ncbi:MFS transporter [Azohydromonas australica]|uniref:MFS transporter n=1 Tax=Azohydromonas australica TaxID=364039 RepID=UPI0004121AD2|nr:MFS transporter [Azohydromonas australica]